LKASIVTRRDMSNVKGSGVHTGMKRKTGYMLRCVAMAHPKPASGIFPVSHQINKPTNTHSNTHMDFRRPL